MLSATRLAIPLVFRRPLAKPVFKSLGGPERRRLASNSTGSADTPRNGTRFFWMTAFAGFGSFVIYSLGSKREADTTEMKDKSFFGRAFSRLCGFFDGFQEPAFERLLPEPVYDPNHPRPYTLVVDLDGFLVTHQWDREMGRWRIAKRPGADLFLFYAAQLYEVVVFSALPQHEGDMIVKKLDPFGCISHSLFRFATKYERGAYLKDISRLNRDLAKVVVLGHDEKGFASHPENYIKMAPWKGQQDDMALEETVDFLEMLALSRLPDVRPAVKLQQGKHFPGDFDKVQEDVYEEGRQQRIQSLESRAKNPIFRFFGLAHSTTAIEAPRSYREKKLERIELRRKEYRHLRKLMEQQLQAEQQREREYYAQHKMPLWDLFAKGPPPPAPPPAEPEQPFK